jgi:hypothetical protein
MTRYLLLKRVERINIYLFVNKHLHTGQNDQKTNRNMETYDHDENNESMKPNITNMFHYFSYL